MSADFVHVLSERIAPDGVLHLATDWEEYAYQMIEVIDSSGRFVNDGGTSGSVVRTQILAIWRVHSAYQPPVSAHTHARAHTHANTHTTGG